MPRISKQSINEVRLRANFVELVSDYTTLKRSGSSWKGLSPFAPEKTPSFYVHPDKEFCYCFSTGQGGDIFRFLMLKESLSFQDAVERVAHRFGIDLHYEDGPSETAEQRTLRAQLYELHEEAVSIFINAFRAKNAAAGALRDYWRDTRKFSDDVAAEFNIGFAPADGANLAAILNQRGFTKEALAASGLFTGIDYNPDPLRWHPRFHNRLIIPIRDAQGRTVAFTARLLPFAPQAETDPTRNAKYVNSPETPIFHKSQLLFNLDRAKDATKDGTPIVLVEGQLDAIRAYTTGAKTAVAGQGTAVGEAHMLLLKRYCKSVDLLLDADRAGQAAALKIIPLALAASLEPRILHVPGGKDPDEFLASAGTDGWKQIIEQPIDAASFIARALLPKGAEHSDIEKATALASFFEIASNAESTVTQGTLLDRVATQSALNPLDVRSDFKRYVKRQRDLKRLRENAKRKAAEANEIANGNEVTETAGAGEAAAAGDVADIDGTTAAGEVVAASGAAGATGAVAAAAAAAAAAESAAAAAAAALAETTATFTSVQT